MIGIDEVGRGCWAGPLLVVAARQIGELPTGLADSKVLSKKKRQSLFYNIQISCEIGEGWVSVPEINEIGLSKSLFLGVERALDAIDAVETQDIIMDGNVNYCPQRFTKAKCIIDADANFPIVSAASIYAKVLRDKYMAEQGLKFPLYKFENHVGYGTKLHQEMIRLHGTCEIHRINWRPFQKVSDV